jgi:hypothetical protein
MLMQTVHIITIVFKRLAYLLKAIWSRNSAVSIATGYGLENQGVPVREFCHLQVVQTSLLANGYRGLLPRGKAAGV